MTALHERLDNLRKETESFLHLTSKVAVLEQQMKDVREKTDETAKRGWSIIQIVIGAVIGGNITLMVQVIARHLLSPLP